MRHLKTQGNEFRKIKKWPHKARNKKQFRVRNLDQKVKMFQV